MVEFRKNACLPKLGNARHEKKAEHPIIRLNDSKKLRHFQANFFEKILIPQHGRQWRVIFVDQQNDRSLALLTQPARYLLD